MIGFVRGVLVEVWDKCCLVVTAGGVGYSLGLPGHTFAELPQKGSEVAFYTTLVVREDAMELFGFSTFEEKQAFEILTGISKIGSRTALAILGLYRPVELQKLVLEDNVAALTRVSGIGQKTAQHILLELKYKMGSIKSSLPRVGTQLSPVFNDTLAALANLGYSEDECVPLIRELLKEEPDLDVGGAIRQALKALSKGKS